MFCLLIAYNVEQHESHIAEFISLGSVLQKYRMSYDLEEVQLCSVILNLVSHAEHKLIVQRVSPELHKAGFGPSRLFAQAQCQYTTFILWQ